MKKSFTLIEVLVATSIFIIILAVAMATIWSVMTPKAKTESMSAVQKSTRLIMETMVESVKKANAYAEYWPGPRRYINFAIAQSGGGVPEDIEGISEGYTLKTLYKPEVPGGKKNLRAFRIYKWTEGTNGPGTRIDIAECSPSSTEHCILKMDTVTADNSGIFHMSDAQYKSLSSLNEVDVIYLKFSGHYWTIQEITHDTAPYVDIEIKVRSRNLNNQGKYDEYTLRNTVTPTYMIHADEGNELMQLKPIARAYLYLNGPLGSDWDNTWWNMGEYVESSFDVAYAAVGTNSGWYGGAVWDTYSKESGTYNRLDPGNDDNPYNHGANNSDYHCADYYTISSGQQNSSLLCLKQYTNSTMPSDVKNLLLENAKILVCTNKSCSDDPGDEDGYNNYLGTVHLVSGGGTDGVKDHGRFIEATIGLLRTPGGMFSRANPGGHVSIFSKAVNQNQTPYAVAGSYQRGEKSTGYRNIDEVGRILEDYFNNDNLDLRVINEVSKKDIGPLKVFYGNDNANNWQYKGKFRESSAGSRWDGWTVRPGPGGGFATYYTESVISFINPDGDWDHDYHTLSSRVIRDAVKLLFPPSGDRYLIGY